MVFAAAESGSKIRAFAVDSGLQRWEFGGLGGPLTTGPAVVTVAGQQRVAAASGSRLVLLDPVSGRLAGRWDLPQGSSVRMTATGPLVIVDSAHAQIVVGGRLVSRVVPATGTPVAPTADGGLLVVGSGGQLWTVSDSQVAGSAVKLPGPAGGSFAAVAGWVDGHLVLAFDVKSASVGADRVRLVSYSRRDGRWAVDWTTAPLSTADGSGSQTELPLRSGPEGRWGIYGTSTVDLRSGSTTALTGGWQTSAVGDGFAFGVGEGRPLAARKTGVLVASMKAARLDSGSTVVAPQAVAGTTAFLVAASAGSGSTATLYALPLPDAANTKTSGKPAPAISAGVGGDRK
jgi:hypothetical protein